MSCTLDLVLSQVCPFELYVYLHLGNLLIADGEITTSLFVSFFVLFVPMRLIRVAEAYLLPAPVSTEALH